MIIYKHSNIENFLNIIIYRKIIYKNIINAIFEALKWLKLNF